MSGEVVLYRTQDGKAQIQFRSVDGTVWLSQGEIAELFDTTKQNVGMHAKNIIEEGELPEESVVKESFTTAADGKNYRVKVYRIEKILAIGMPRTSRLWSSSRNNRKGRDPGHSAASLSEACRPGSELLKAIREFPGWESHLVITEGCQDDERPRLAANHSRTGDFSPPGRHPTCPDRHVRMRLRPRDQ